ncbi:hypothetical protein ACOMHN_062185 [Nucella lapillus]
MKWLMIKSVSLENVREVDDPQCLSTAQGMELVSFAPPKRQNGFCVHESSQDEKELGPDSPVTSVDLVSVSSHQSGLRKSSTALCWLVQPHQQYHAASATTALGKRSTFSHGKKIPTEATRQAWFGGTR